MTDLTQDEGYDAANGEMTVDELARRAGMTVRNMRTHQSRACSSRRDRRRRR